VEPGGGVSAAALSGWRVIRMLCKKDRKKFSASRSCEMRSPTPG
jgi:hypothetical protein